MRLHPSGAAVTVEAQRIFTAVGDREGEADALRMQVGAIWLGGRLQAVNIAKMVIA
jgi:hypothetical protein